MVKWKNHRQETNESLKAGEGRGNNSFLAMVYTDHQSKKSFYKDDRMSNIKSVVSTQDPEFEYF